MKGPMSFPSLLVAKLRAALLHGILTLVVALVSAFVVFYVWYPAQLARMLGGDGLYLLVLLVEVCLGPVMSLVIYNPRKPRAELIRDYTLVGMIQLAALTYGLHSAYISRPVYMVFVVDRIEVVSALELDDKDLSLATNKAYQSLPEMGPLAVCIQRPESPQARSDILLSALDGKDVHLMPRYYRQCNENESFSATRRGRELVEGLKERGRYKTVVERLPADLDFTWLPVKSRFGAWIEIYPKGRQEKAHYVSVDPFM